MLEIERRGSKFAENVCSRQEKNLESNPITESLIPSKGIAAENEEPLSVQPKSNQATCGPHRDHGRRATTAPAWPRPAENRPSQEIQKSHRGPESKRRRAGLRLHPTPQSD
jgi:hypothetical protein